MAVLPARASSIRSHCVSSMIIIPVAIRRLMWLFYPTSSMNSHFGDYMFIIALAIRARILVQVVNRRLLIGRDGHLDQSEAYDLS